MALFAGDRGIMTGEELTYDYNFDPYSQKNVQVCRCGAENCRGVLGPKPKDLPKPKDEKEGKLAGAKRKIGEILEESTNLLNKKRKTKEPPKLAKGWAYVEPEAKAKKETNGKAEADRKRGASEDGGFSRRPSKLKRMLSQKSNKSANTVGSSKMRRRSNARVVSTSSAAALIVGDGESADAEDNLERPKSGLSTAASFKAKAEGLRRLGRSLRARA